MSKRLDMIAVRRAQRILEHRYYKKAPTEGFLWSKALDALDALEWRIKGVR